MSRNLPLILHILYYTIIITARSRRLGFQKLLHSTFFRFRPPLLFILRFNSIPSHAGPNTHILKIYFNYLDFFYYFFSLVQQKQYSMVRNVFWMRQQCIRYGDSIHGRILLRYTFFFLLGYTY